MSTHYTLKSILIPLTKKQVARVSPVDADLWHFKWCATFNESYGGDGAYMAKRHLKRINGKSKYVYMHRAIVSKVIGRELLRSEHIDHINLDPLDNRRCNLRLATNSQNNMNTRKRRDNTSGFKGVYWHSHSRKWHARITKKGVTKSLGYFNTPEEAHQAYCAAAIKDFGKFARFE